MPETKTAYKFKTKCSKCLSTFESSPGELNSTEFLGWVSKFAYLPKCPHCGNWRDNQLVDPDGTLTEVLRTRR